MNNNRNYNINNCNETGLHSQSSIRLSISISCDAMMNGALIIGIGDAY